jgi:hypothetical protein
MSSNLPERIVLGLGGTVDYEIELDPRIIQDLITLYLIQESELDAYREIVNSRDLIVSLLAYMRVSPRELLLVGRVFARRWPWEFLTLAHCFIS